MATLENRIAALEKQRRHRVEPINCTEEEALQAYNKLISCSDAGAGRSNFPKDPNAAARAYQALLDGA